MDLSTIESVGPLFFPNGEEPDLKEWRTTMRRILYEHGVMESESLRREEWYRRCMMRQGRFEVKDWW